MLPEKEPSILYLHTTAIKHITPHITLLMWTGLSRVSLTSMYQTLRYFTGIATCFQLFVCTCNAEPHAQQRASSVVQARLWLFYHVKRHRLVFGYRRFGITYRSRLQCKAVQENHSILEDGTDRLSRKVGNIPRLKDCTPPHCHFLLVFGSK